MNRNGNSEPRRRRRLDPYREEIVGLLEQDHAISAREIEERLRPRVGDIALSTVKRYVRELRREIAETEELRPEARADAVTPPHRDPIPQPGADGGFDLTSPFCFLNRELTWLNFNYRVLHEAEDERTPLLERVKFISIVSSNLDEFFMKRVGGLKQQVGAGVHKVTVDGRTPREQIDESLEVVRDLVARKRSVLTEVEKDLGEHGIELLAWDELNKDEKKRLREHYLENVYPLVTPQATDPAHPFPFISNLSLNLLVTLTYPNDPTPCMARVKVPVGIGTPRLLRVRGRKSLIRIEEVMANNLDLLFPGMQIESCSFFRVTRNANTEMEEEHADDLLAMIQTELRERKFAPVVRLEVSDSMPMQLRGLLAAELGLDERSDVFEVDGMLGIRDLMELCDIADPELHDPPHHPADHPEFKTDRNIFHVIRDAGSLLVHHPYEAYSTSVERFLRDASRDPKVRAIKMTLYRTSAESKVMEYLIDAARNGKQVAVVVELKARFDEAANIRWANRLEEVGIHVTYGVVGLKTHCKVILVVRQDYNGLKRYAHVGTGNYHAGTARLYSDLGLLTCDRAIGRDLTELVNYLTTGYKPKRSYEKLLVAPKACKSVLIAKINREIEHHQAGEEGLVQIKVNAVEDADVVRALYRASQAGVQVDLVVRDTCRLRPGIPGLSGNARVVSIVGRFLEHARVYYFRNGGEEEYYIGSADCMKRNLESRVEVLAPVEDDNLRARLRELLDVQLDDPRSAWDMRPDGSYVQRSPEPGTKAQGAQQVLIDWSERRLKSVTRLRKRRTRGITRRNIR
jgi:polyphosphate kinase